MTILVFLVILTILVLIHELGHLIVAKKFNIKVEEFGFGLPPRLWGKKFGETLYSLNWLPIGGFVKLYGEDEAGAGRISQKIKLITDKSRAFYTRSPWQRATVIIAGVFMNFVLSVIITSFLLGSVGAPVLGDRITVIQVIKSSPADLAGIRSGDRITYINGVKVTSNQELIEVTRKNLGKEVVFKLLSGQKEREVKITPRKEYPKDQGPMGIVLNQNLVIKRYSWLEAPFAGFVETLKTGKLIVVGFATLIVQFVTTGSVPAEVAGPVGIAQLTGQVVAVGPFAVLALVSLLSLNLAIVNILPIPALDGGRLFFILIELIARKKVHPRFEALAHSVGMAIVLTLIALIAVHDIARIISGQPLLPR